MDLADDDVSMTSRPSKKRSFRQSSSLHSEFVDLDAMYSDDEGHGANNHNHPHFEDQGDGSLLERRFASYRKRQRSIHTSPRRALEPISDLEGLPSWHSHDQLNLPTMPDRAIKLLSPENIAANPLLRDHSRPLLSKTTMHAREPHPCDMEIVAPQPDLDRFSLILNAPLAARFEPPYPQGFDGLSQTSSSFHHHIGAPRLPEPWLELLAPRASSGAVSVSTPFHSHPSVGRLDFEERMVLTSFWEPDHL